MHSCGKMIVRVPHNNPLDLPRRARWLLGHDDCVFDKLPQYSAFLLYTCLLWVHSFLFLCFDSSCRPDPEFKRPFGSRLWVQCLQYATFRVKLKIFSKGLAWMTISSQEKARRMGPHKLPLPPVDMLTNQNWAHSLWTLSWCFMSVAKNVAARKFHLR